MLVDEYQDTNVAQYLWLRLLAQAPAARAQHLLRRRRRPVDLWLARRGGRQHPALREGFSRRRPSSGWSATIARPGISSPPPPHLIAHNEGRLGKTLFTDDEDGRARHGRPAPGILARRRAPSATRSRRCSARATRSNEMAILVRASFQMREFEDRFVTLGLPYRVIGGPRFYERPRSATPSPISAPPCSRPTTSPSSGSSTRRSAGLGDATMQMLHDYARAATACR